MGCFITLQSKKHVWQKKITSFCFMSTKYDLPSLSSYQLKLYKTTASVKEGKMHLCPRKGGEEEEREKVGNSFPGQDIA